MATGRAGGVDPGASLPGLFGGVAGNQGGIRAAALTSFGLGPQAFVATATATALLVDVARTPVYLWQAGGSLRMVWVPWPRPPSASWSAPGSASGCWWACRPALFSKLVALGVGALGIWLLVSG